MARDESQTAKAIKQMREIHPGFSVHELEHDAKGIFELAYVYYLNDNLAKLSKFCGEQALAYFKVQIKKREADVKKLFRNASLNLKNLGLYIVLNGKMLSFLKEICPFLFFILACRKFIVWLVSKMEK